MNRCVLCPRISYRRPIPPDGPRPCRILLLGEGPSFDEDEKQCVFSGKTGFELNQTYLPLLGLPRSQVTIANATWCSQPTYQNPTREQALSCASVHLAPLLSEVRPYIIAPMGAVACSLWPEINLSHDHGIPFLGRWGGWSGCLFPMYHPSSGLHNSAWMISLMNDFDVLGKLLKKLQQL